MGKLSSSTRTTRGKQNGQAVTSVQAWAKDLSRESRRIADKLERAVAMEFNALFDLALHFPDVKVNAFTTQTMVGAIADKISAAFTNVETRVGPATPLQGEIDVALSALGHIRDLMHDSTTNEFDPDHRVAMEPEAIGRCLYGFTADAAVAFERIEQALGAVPSNGFVEKSVSYYEQLAKESRGVHRG